MRNDKNKELDSTGSCIDELLEYQKRAGNNINYFVAGAVITGFVALGALVGSDSHRLSREQYTQSNTGVEVSAITNQYASASSTQNVTVPRTQNMPATQNTNYSFVQVAVIDNVGKTNYGNIAGYSYDSNGNMIRFAIPFREGMTNTPTNESDLEMIRTSMNTNKPSIPSGIRIMSN